MVVPENIKRTIKYSRNIGAQEIRDRIAVLEIREKEGRARGEG